MHIHMGLTHSGTARNSCRTVQVSVYSIEDDEQADKCVFLQKRYSMSLNKVLAASNMSMKTRSLTYMVLSVKFVHIPQ